MKKSRKGSFQKENALPQQRLLALWSWLPAFRATAETGSLSAAARLLSVSPSAVSRSLRLLEAEIGAPLFVRSEGEALRVNAAGEKLAQQVRGAMRLIDDGLRARSTLHTSVPAGVALPATKTYVDLAEATRALQNGDTDAVLVVGDAAVPEGITSETASVATHWWRRTTVVA